VTVKMARVHYVLAVLAALAVLFIAAEAGTMTAEQQFRQFAAQYGKSYASEEFGERLRIFRDNLDRIDALNSANTGARYGVNKFADLTPKEFKATYLKGARSAGQKKAAATAKLDMTGPLPSQFDWRDKGAVTPTKDQGQCGSCWAFSVTEAIESQWFLSGRKLVSLAPQQIVDCDQGNGDYGCDGGDPPTAYEYVIKAGGLDTEESYPYTAEDGQCAFKPSAVGAKISNWTYITTTKNETEMQYGLASRGPLSICVDASSWQYYIGGVITSLCEDSLDHCVMITGYSVQEGWDFMKYDVWNIRNSWGEDWGYGGYLYVQRGSNLCGVGDEVTIPLV